MINMMENIMVNIVIPMAGIGGRFLDAGYEKAMQIWGHKPGWVKPGYRPKRKELDIEAIKKWFKPGK